VVFTGAFEHAIDAKNRIAVPAEIRALLLPSARAARPTSPSGGGAGPDDTAASDSSDSEGGRGGAAGEVDRVPLYVTLLEGLDGLAIYTETQFHKRAEQLEESELDADEVLEYELALYTQTRRVEMDKQGRIRLPAELLDLTPLESEVVLLGVKDHLEIRDRATWKARMTEMLAKRRLLGNPRRKLRRKRGGSPDGADEDA